MLLSMLLTRSSNWSQRAAAVLSLSHSVVILSALLARGEMRMRPLLNKMSRPSASSIDISEQVFISSRIIAPRLRLIGTERWLI